MESRRRFLTGSLAAGTLAIAGCGGISGDGDDDGTNDDGTNDDTGSDGTENGGDETESPGTYADLLIGTEERPVRATGRKIGELAGVGDFGGITDEEEVFGLSPTDVEYSADVSTGQENYAVILGPFEFDAVVAEYEDGDAEVSETDEYGEFRTVEVTIGGNTFLAGIGDGVLVNALSQERYEQVIDTIEGEGTALLGTGRVLDDIAAILGDPDIVLLELEPEQLQIDPSGEAVAGGASLDVAEGESAYTAVVAYETAEAASENETDVGDAAVEAEPALESVDTSVEDRLVVVRGDATTADL